jgi:hypothetical protein
MAKQGRSLGEIPRQVIPLPDPPSDCDSAYIMSDGSITASFVFGSDRCDGSTIADIDLEDQLPEKQAVVTMTKPRSALRSNPQYSNYTTSGVLQPIKISPSDSSSSHTKTSTSSNKRVTLVATSPAQQSKQYRQDQQHNNNDHSTLSTTNRSHSHMGGDNSLENNQRGRRKQSSSNKSSSSWCTPTMIYSLFGIALTIVVVAIGINLLLYFDNQSNATTTDDGTSTIDFTATSAPTNNSTLFPNTTMTTTTPKDTRTMVEDILTNQFRITIPTSAEDDSINLAVQWLVNETQTMTSDGSNSSPMYGNLEKFGQRFALLVMRYALAPPSGSSRVSQEFLTFPQPNQDECNWVGVKCSSSLVAEIDFSDYSLKGTIPKEIRLLTNLQILDLSNNNIQSTLPEEIYFLRNLKRLYRKLHGCALCMRACVCVSVCVLR